jgi:deoxyribonuclease-4
MNVGAHVRGGGKLVPSLELGVEMGATSIQIFTQSPRMWKPSLYAPEVLAGYREAAAKNLTITDTFCHATYLINLATADLELYEKSVATLTHNLSVARGMGSSGLILHVGSHHGAGFDQVVRQIADAFERALADADPTPEGEAECPILIENAAGSGGTVGRSLEEIHLLIDACNSDDRLGLCIDTQHLWASGFDYSTVAGTERLIKEIELTVGIERLRCFHFNDSKTELGGNRDRHANIGEGTIGTRGLATLTGHPLIRNLPLLLEVPGAGDGPRAEDVEVGKQVVRAGIALWEGSADWEQLLPVVVLVAANTTAAKSPKAPAIATPKKAAPAAKSPTSTKKSAKKTVKKSAKKTVKKAAKKTTAKATKSAKKLAKKTLKKAAKKATKKTTTKATKTAKKLTKKSVKKVAVKSPSKKAAKSLKKAAKRSTAKVTKSAKKTSKKVAAKAPKKTAKKPIVKTIKKSAKTSKKATKKVTKKLVTKKSKKK